MDRGQRCEGVSSCGIEVPVGKVAREDAPALRIDLRESHEEAVACGGEDQGHAERPRVRSDAEDQGHDQDDVDEYKLSLAAAEKDRTDEGGVDRLSWCD